MPSQDGRRVPLLLAPSGQLQLALRTYGHWIVLAGLTFAAGLLGGYRLGAKSFWLDEAISADVAAQDLAGLLTSIGGREMNMGPYYLLLSAWSMLGTSESALRSLSVLLGVIALPPFYLLARRVFTAPLALFAVALLGSGGFFVHYMQEARGYTLALLLAVVSSLAAVRAVERPSTSRWLVYGTLAGVGIYAHFFNALVVGGQFIALLLQGRRSPTWPGWLISAATIALITVPIGLAVLGRGSRLGWIRPLDADRLEGGLRALAGHVSSELAWLILAVWLAGCVVAARRWWLGAGWVYLLAVAWAGVPVVGLIVLSQLQPLFVSRFLFMALPGLALVATTAVSALRPRPLMAIAAVGLLAASFSGTVYWLTEASKPEWREATRFVMRRATGEDGIVFFEPFGSRAFAYYQQRYDTPWPTPVRLPLAAGDGAPSATLDDLLCRASQSGQRLWIVRSHITPASRARLAWFTEHLERYYQRTLRRGFPAVGIHLYEVADGSTQITCLDR